MKRLKKLIKQERYKKVLKLLTESDENVYVSRSNKVNIFHYSCKKGKLDLVSILLKHGHSKLLNIPDKLGNVPLHYAFKYGLSEKNEKDIEKINNDLVLPLLKASPQSLDVRNKYGTSVRQLLALFDEKLKKQEILRKKAEVKGAKTHLNEEANDSYRDWNRRIEEEAEAEYDQHWGKFEKDEDYEFSNVFECYDAWADRILREKRQRTYREVPEVKPKWTKEDQQQFIRKEEKKKILKLEETLEKKRERLYRKLEKGDVKYLLEIETVELGNLIISEINGEEKLKIFKELRRFWHPDKFIQKFGSSLNVEDKIKIDRKVTELSQRINTYIL
ncbi:NF-kappa-B inhibitor-like protein 1 [Artemia franciscana]|uniref:NF-kappa-B inhibitor-like protein 1 n=1 Tax=Artemia franciscana TaxID=6661 RepID=A0AA88HCF8_ARTSF|nr:hypothetical protein QYM36_018407 [Artemia franciscana]